MGSGEGAAREREIADARTPSRRPPTAPHDSACARQDAGTRALRGGEAGTHPEERRAAGSLLRAGRGEARRGLLPAARMRVPVWSPPGGATPRSPFSPRRAGSCWIPSSLSASAGASAAQRRLPRSARAVLTATLQNPECDPTAGHARVRTRTHMHALMHAHSCMRTHARTCTRVRTHSLTRAQIHSHIHAGAHARTHTDTHSRMDACAHARRDAGGREAGGRGPGPSEQKGDQGHRLLSGSHRRRHGSALTAALRTRPAPLCGLSCRLMRGNPAPL